MAGLCPTEDGEGLWVLNLTLQGQYEEEGKLVQPTISLKIFLNPSFKACLQKFVLGRRTGERQPGLTTNLRKCICLKCRFQVLSTATAAIATMV